MYFQLPKYFKVNKRAKEMFDVIKVSKYTIKLQRLKIIFTLNENDKITNVKFV